MWYEHTPLLVAVDVVASLQTTPVRIPELKARELKADALFACNMGVGATKERAVAVRVSALAGVFVERGLDGMVSVGMDDGVSMALSGAVLRINRASDESSASHPIYLHHFIAIVVDNLDRNLARLGFVERITLG